MTKRYLPLLAWLVVTWQPSASLAQPVGPEFQVNTYTTNAQRYPSVAANARGDFVVVWFSEYGQDGDSSGVFGQRYDSGGNRLGGEFRVNTYTTSSQNVPTVASDASGKFVVVWSSYGQDGSTLGVFGQRYDNDGNPLGDEFQVNTYTTGYQGGASVASDSGGNFVVVWSGAGDSDDNGIFGQRYDSNGIPLGDQFQVNTDTYGESRPSVASAAGGNFVVVWRSTYGYDSYEQLDGIFGQRYDANGVRAGGEFQVNTQTNLYQGAPRVTSDAIGNFVVVWTTLAHYSFDIAGQRFDAEGKPLGGEFPVFAQSSSIRPSVASDASGNFVVTWEDIFQEGDREGVFGQRYEADGNRLGGDFQVNTYTTDIQRAGSIASDASGNFVVVWNGQGEGDAYGVFGQRFSAGCGASVQVKGNLHPPGSTVSVQIHIAHHRPKTVTVPWELSLLDASGQMLLRHTTQPHTFEPGDVVDRDVEFPLPNDLASGTYTLELTISGMAGTKGATTTFQVVGPSSSQ